MGTLQTSEKPVPFSSQMRPALLEKVRREADRRGLKLYKALAEMAEEWLRANGKKVAK